MCFHPQVKCFSPVGLFFCERLRIVSLRVCTLKLFKPFSNEMFLLYKSRTKELIGDILLISDAQTLSNTNHKVKNQNKIYITGL